MDSKQVRSSPELAADGGRPVMAGHVLVIEPDELMAWSVATYLRRWFDVVCATSAEEAQQLAERGDFDAIVVSDRVRRDQVTALEARVRDAAPRAQSILMITTDDEPSADAGRAVRIEKPFALADLARLLGVVDPTLC